MLLKDRLKELRKERGETQEDLARMLHVQRSTYGEYERGKIRPPAPKLFLIADHYGVSVDYLVGISDYRQRPDHPQNDVLGHLALFANWLRNPDATPDLDGVGLSDLERSVVVEALEHAGRLLKALREQPERKANS